METIIFKIQLRLKLAIINLGIKLLLFAVLTKLQEANDKLSELIETFLILASCKKNQDIFKHFIAKARRPVSKAINFKIKI